MSKEDKGALRPELNALADAVDAVGDALLAESVHQVVRGNPLRAAMTVEAVAGGETPPPELDVARTPRSGIALTHRIVALFAGDSTRAVGWPRPTFPFRADAEPRLNAWAGSLLGAPAQVRFLVERIDPGSGRVLDTRDVSLGDLGLSPLDLVYAEMGAHEAEIERRVLYTLARSPTAFPAGAVVRVGRGRGSDWPASALGYGAFAELLRSVRDLIAGGRGMDADDLNPPVREDGSGLDIDELERRATAAEQSLRQAVEDLGDPSDVERLRTWLLRAAAFGLASAVPASAVGAGPAILAALRDQAAAARGELSRRMEQIPPLAGSDAPERRARAEALLRGVYGQTFTVLPLFQATNASELEQSLAARLGQPDADPLAATTWFQRMARVRDGAGRLDAALGLAEVLGHDERLELGVAQLPFDAKDRWVALPLEANKTTPAGKLSLVVQSPTPLNFRQPLAGLLVDEWVEVVPNATETTGIAVQYDQPNAAPPQAILIAVPPDLDAPWTPYSLQKVLLETLDLARIRGVDPDALGEVGHFLPALYFAYNSKGDALSLDFTKLL